MGVEKHVSGQVYSEFTWEAALCLLDMTQRQAARKRLKAIYEPFIKIRSGALSHFAFPEIE